MHQTLDPLTATTGPFTLGGPDPLRGPAPPVGLGAALVDHWTGSAVALGFGGRGSTLDEEQLDSGTVAGCAVPLGWDEQSQQIVTETELLVGSVGRAVHNRKCYRRQLVGGGCPAAA